MLPSAGLQGIQYFEPNDGEIFWEGGCEPNLEPEVIFIMEGSLPSLGADHSRRTVATLETRTLMVSTRDVGSSSFLDPPESNNCT